MNTVPPDRIQQGIARCHTPAAANAPARPRRQRVVKITRHMQSYGKNKYNQEHGHVSRGGLLRHHLSPDGTDACRPGGGQEDCRSRGWDNTPPWVHRGVGKRSFMRRPEQVRSSSVSAQVKKRGHSFIGYVRGLVCPDRRTNMACKKSHIIVLIYLGYYKSGTAVNQRAK